MSNGKRVKTYLLRFFIMKMAVAISTTATITAAVTPATGREIKCHHQVCIRINVSQCHKLVAVGGPLSPESFPEISSAEPGVSSFESTLGSTTSCVVEVLACVVTSSVASLP